jgi:F-type H+-transporting ATPase subunit epsilon
MAAIFNVSILSPDKKIFDGVAESLVAPTGMGYVGILAHHAPFITMLGQGKITVRDSAGKITAFDCTDGFMEVSQNKATLLIGS